MENIINLQNLINDMKQNNKYRFFRVDVHDGSVVQLTKILTDTIVEEYNELVNNKNNENNDRKIDTLFYGFIVNHDKLDVKEMFGPYDEDFQQMCNHYTEVYYIFCNLGLFDEGIDDNILKKFDEYYDCGSYLIKVRLYNTSNKNIHIEFKMETLGDKID